MIIDTNRGAAAALAAVLALAAPAAARTLVPTPDHVVIVMEENHGYGDIIGSANAPYINQLAAEGALFTDAHAITHPSQPNYLDLFSGADQGVTDDSCPHSFAANNEGRELIKAGLSFAGYAEGLPAAGSLVCTAGEYARKHAPWTNFTDLHQTRTDLPFAGFPADYDKLPAVAWVIPNLLDDMHDGSIAKGDAWLKTNLDAYVTWAQTHNSLLILTFDEDDGTKANRIATIFVGPMAAPGQYGEHIDHFTVLRTVEAMYGVKPIGQAATAKPIRDVWR